MASRKAPKKTAAKSAASKTKSSGSKRPARKKAAKRKPKAKAAKRPQPPKAATLQAEPPPAIEAWPPPTWIGDKARAEWPSACDELRRAAIDPSKVNQTHLAIYCQLTAQVKRAGDLVDELGQIAETRNDKGTVTKTEIAPEVLIQEKFTTRLRQFWQDFTKQNPTTPKDKATPRPNANETPPKTTAQKARGSLLDILRPRSN